MIMATILLGDNQKEDLRIWGEVLQRAGYKVIKASNLRKARKHLESGKPDLAVLDLHWLRDGMMDDLSGFDLAKEFSTSVPCILFTSLADGPTTRAILRKGNRGREEDLIDLVFKHESEKDFLDAVKRNLV